MFRLWRKWIAFLIGWAMFVPVMVVLIDWVSVASTQSPMERFEARYHASLVDGQVQLAVEEEIGLQLFNERGIYRDLPWNYGSTEITYGTFSVRDPDGSPAGLETERLPNGDIRLVIGGDERKSGYRTFVVRYTIEGAMSGTDEHQELYFNTNGVGWENGFRHFSATLTLGPDLAAHRTGEHACYFGKAGSTTACDLRVDAATYHYERSGVGPYENTTFAVGFQPGAVADPIPPFEAASHGWWGIAGLLGIGVAGVLVALAARAIAGRLEVGEDGVVTRFEPPERLLPITAADYLGRPERGAAAHLAWLVVEGHAEIRSPKEAAEATSSDDYRSWEIRQLAEHMSMRWEAEGLDRRQQRITEGLFGTPGKLHAITADRYSVGLDKAQELRDQLVDSLRLRKRVDVGSTLFTLGYVGVLGYGLAQIWLGLAGLGMWFFAAGLVAILLLVWARHLTPMHYGFTENGRETHRQLLGLQRFVAMSESGRISWLQNVASAPRDDEGRLHLYERLLPWAIVFGEERSWAQAVGAMVSRFPSTATPHFSGFAGIVSDVSRRDTDYHRRRRRHHQATSWGRRPDIGEGGLSQAFSGFGEWVSDASSGRSSSSSSTSSSGRGWGGGRSSGGGRASSGRGSSGGGMGGGGGGRR
ncbi:MAG: DUF2207 domain-containing protein [Propionibacterium sp.]|nr:DUF2207 domain-containing protein [Propionibacterium sp.]